MKTIKRLIISSILVVVAIIVLRFVVAMFWPWTEFDCRHEEVDITTGRIRLTRYLLYRKVSERVEESALSKVLSADMVATAKPEWHKVYTFSPGPQISPHYIFHSAIYQIRDLAWIWEWYDLPEELRKQTARHVLALWQYSGSDWLAGQYVCGLYDLNEPDKREQILSALPTLQMPLVETNGDEVTRTVFFPNGQPLDRTHGYMSPSGEFIRRGVWEYWRPDGTKEEKYIVP